MFRIVLLLISPYLLDSTKLDRVRPWFSEMEDHLFKECPMRSRPASLAPVFTRTGPCQEEGSSSEYRFIGPLNTKGEFDGFGTLILHESFKDLYNHTLCIKTTDVFGKPIYEVIGMFVEGRPHGEVAVLFKDDSRDWAFVHAVHGVLHGRYRYFYHSGQLAQIGTFQDGVLSDKETWSSFATGWSYKKTKKSLFMFLKDKTDHSAKMIDDQIAVVTVADEIQVVREDQNCVLEVDSPVPTNYSYKYNVISNEPENEVDDLCSIDEQDPKNAVRKWLAKFEKHPNGQVDPFWNILPDSSAVSGKQKLLSNVEHIRDEVFRAIVSIHDRKRSVKFVHDCSVDQDGNFHGYCSLSFLPDQINHCAGLVCSYPTIEHLVGTFKNGVLNGRVSVLYNRTVISHFRVKNGVLHGLFAEFGRTGVYNKDAHITRGVALIGAYKDGRLVGSLWIGLIGGGYLFGATDPKKPTITDMSGVFLYPWSDLALVGKFTRNIMISARKTRVIGGECSDTGIIVPIVEEGVGHVFRYDPPNVTSYGDSPTVRDPFDEERIDIRESGIEGAGKGTFAKVDMKRGETASLYSGMHLTPEDVAARDEFCLRKVAGKDVEKTKVRQTNIMHKPEFCQDEFYFKYLFGTDEEVLRNYLFNVYDAWFNATSGHMTNCKVGREANAKFGLFEHPRYGFISSLELIKDVKRSQEIFVDYGYDVYMPFVDWYFKMKPGYEENKKGFEKHREKYEKHIKFW